MPRMTVRIDDDVVKLARAHAARNQLTVSEALNYLARRGACRPLVTEERNGLQVVKLDGSSPRVTTALVERLRDET